MQHLQDNLPDNRVCSLTRRIAAMFYDALLLLSLWFFATWILLPLSDGEAISSDNRLYPVYLYAIGYLYFAWQWRHGGQTLGMRAWHIRLIVINGTVVTWGKSLQRYLLATFSLLVFGLGYFHAFLDANRLTLHDKYSGTYPVNTVK